MIAQAILLCALSPQPMAFAHADTRAAINAYHLMKSEEEKEKKSSDEKKLTRWIRKNNPDAEVFITPRGDAEKLKEYGWERVPITWNDKEIWVKRKPVSDQNKQRRILASA